MKKFLHTMVLLVLCIPVSSQVIREFSADTAYREELVRFTGSALESSEVPDFERFLLLFDSLPHENRLQIIEISNLLLERRARPRPHFIALQRIMTEFFAGQKTSYGYDQWLEGLNIFLSTEDATPWTISQWLSLSPNPQS
ncbi:MAG: hypothetical protein EHM46_01470, partial [Bacteroidetes bacterium]